MSYLFTPGFQQLRLKEAEVGLPTSEQLIMQYEVQQANNLAIARDRGRVKTVTMRNKNDDPANSLLLWQTQGHTSPE